MYIRKQMIAKKNLNFFERVLKKKQALEHGFQ
jgi:hypothetical protein